MILYNSISYTSWYTQECQKITTQKCRRSIELLEKVVENCRIYEVSKNVVESSRKMLSNPVEKCCRNQSKFVEICRNLSKCRKMLSKPVEKCCRNVENVFFDFSYPLAIRVKKIASRQHPHTRAWEVFFFEFFFWIFFEFFGVI